MPAHVSRLSEVRDLIVHIAVLLQQRGSQFILSTFELFGYRGDLPLLPPPVKRRSRLPDEAIGRDVLRRQSTDSL